MNDTDPEKWLAERFRVAPNPEPPERLRQAIHTDRIQPGVSRGWAGPGRIFGLSDRRSLIARLVGLAATLVLAVGLLTVVVTRLEKNGPASGVGINWQLTAQVPGVTFDFGPHLASAGGRLYMVVKGSTTEVWSSADRATWSREPGDAAIATNFVLRDTSDDGADGLLIAGETLVGETQTPAVWHSSDGRTFTKAQVEVTASSEIVSVAARPGRMVAFGDHATILSNDGLMFYSLDAWYSADGATWSHVDLPESKDYQAIAITAWKGGFAAVANASLGQQGAAWTSTDGRTWEKAPTALAGFGAAAMAAIGDRVVAVGSTPDDVLGMVPASWSSTDGRTWVESTASVRGPAFMFDDVTVVGDILAAIGSSHMGASLQIAGVPESTAPPTPPESVWTSGDGMTWRLLAEDSSLRFGMNPDTHMASFDGRVVVATRGNNAVEVFSGDMAK